MQNQNNNVAMEAIQSQESLLTKGIDTSTLSSTTYGAGLVTPQNLSPLIANLAQRETSFYDRVSKPSGEGDAVVFNKVEALFGDSEDANPFEAIYGDGGTPAERSTKYASETNPFVPVGYKGKVTGKAARRAKGGTPADLEADEVRKTMQRVRQALDWLAFWSRDDVTNSGGESGFKGLDQLITTNVVDAAGRDFKNNGKELMQEVSRKIAYQGGAGQLSHIFASPGAAMDLDDHYNDDNRVIINQGGQGDDLTMGNFVSKIKTRVGTPEVIGAYFLNPGNPYPQGGDGYQASSADEGIANSTAFFLAMDWIEYEELLPMSKVDLAITGDFTNFMVIQDGTIKLQAEPWCAKIINLTETNAN